MNKKICPLEKEVMRGLSRGKLSGELQNHIAGCSVCRDIVAVSEWMNRFKESAWKTDMPGKILPDAESMWNRVRARKRPDKKLVQKALRPLIIPQVLFYGVLIAGIVYMTFWSFNNFGNILDSQIISQIVPFFFIMMIIVVISLSFCAIVVVVDRRKHPTNSGARYSTP
jgi:hypothetical protein